jgi:hypothetical protein
VLPGEALLVSGSALVVDASGGARRGWRAWTDASGAVVRTLAVPGADEIFALAVAPSGAIALAGYTQGSGGYVMELSPAGDVLWDAVLGLGAAAYGVGFAPEGDVVACGSDQGGWIGRWSPAGQLAWRQTYSADADGFSYGLAVAPTGDVAAAGGRAPVVAVSVGPDGAQRWAQRFADLGSTYGVGGIAVDAGGGVILAGGAGEDGYVAKLDATGALAWLQRISTPASDFASAVAAGPDGGAVVVGSRGLASGVGGAFAARYDASGAPVWTTDWAGAWPTTLNGVAIDATGDAFVVGSSPADAFGFHRSGLLGKVDRTGAVQ